MDSNEQAADELVDLLERGIEERASRRPRELKSRPPFSGIEVSVPGTEDVEFSLIKALALRTGKADPTSREFGQTAEVLREAMDRADLDSSWCKSVAAATDSGGGFLVPVEVSSSIIEEIAAKTIAARAGVQTYTGLRGTYSANKRDTTIQTYHVDSEGLETITESTPTWGRLEWRPHTIAAYTTMSLGMMRDTNAEDDIRSQMFGALTRGVDKMVFVGSGANSEPKGLFNYDITSVDFTGATTFTGAGEDVSTTFNSMRQQLRAADIEMTGNSSVSWVAEPRVLNAVEAVTDAATRPKLVSWASDKPSTDKLFGIPIYETSLISNSDATELRLALGDFRYSALGMWNVLAFDIQAGEHFKKLGWEVRAYTVYDFLVTRTEAFRIATNLDNANTPT